MTMTFSLLMMVMMLLHVATLFWTTDWWFARKALKIQEREFGAGHRLLVAVLEPKSVVALNAYHPYIIVIVIDVHKPSILRFWKLPKFVQKSCQTFLHFVASRALAPKAPAMRSFAKAFREDCRVQFRPRGPLRSLCNANVSIVSCPMQGLMVSQSWIRNRSLLDKEACLRPKKSRSKSFAPWLKSCLRLMVCTTFEVAQFTSTLFVCPYGLV